MADHARIDALSGSPGGVHRSLIEWLRGVRAGILAGDGDQSWAGAAVYVKLADVDQWLSALTVGNGVQPSSVTSSQAAVAREDVFVDADSRLVRDLVLAVDMDQRVVNLEPVKQAVARWKSEQTSPAEAAPPENEPDVQLLAYAVVNCHTLARRALARTTSAYDREKWEHVQRICEKAGARSTGVLRASVPTQLTEGSAEAAKQEQEPRKRWTDELCSRCGGNGVVKIPGGVSVCDRCDGRCYEPEAAAPQKEPPQ